MKKLIFLVVTTLLCQWAWASGYQVKLQGARQTGMGNTAVALDPDASSIFFNPGALAFMDSTNMVMLGVSAVRNANTYYDPVSNYKKSTDSGISTPFYVYGAWGPKGARYKFGLGVYTPYGSTVKWGNDWKGKALLHELSLAAICIQPTASFRITDRVSIGAGFVYATGSVNLQRSVDLAGGTSPAMVELDGKASGTGFNAGIMVKPTDKLNIGISYRSKIEMEVKQSDGEVIFTTPATPLTFPTKFGAILPLPAVTTFGFSYKLTDKLTLAADAALTAWSAYKKLAFDFDVNSFDSESPRNYKDAWQFNFGAEYKIMDNLVGRVGYYHDRSGVKLGYMTPETPDSHRNSFTLGASYKMNNLFFDASFLFVNGQKRNQTLADVNREGTVTAVLPGEYKLNGYIGTLTVGYKF
ncbi:MAG: OmpP1/FadL family transporter [Flammeovirgaceae bacterium]